MKTVRRLIFRAVAWRTMLVALAFSEPPLATLALG